ncbi:inactive leucine-rich repeat receptor-like serine/threonine-protein kinase [Prunus yedoensis var. nudiflora]|uniref:Inactive leucine-rich repeat receptor-like serine/threonine-protein kinase n=1 Tax=Prunus yedoensis var. nudiflora TaxID=2094558 RepID=A0A314Z171_PRUYE|nr:inactive leucine-rich repeat receptor-like serine/threonine-protein kinase [Prunus yedoensis var. nudiflora]
MEQPYCLNLLPWQQGSNVCEWEGVKDCMKGRVTKLVLEYLNLTGVLDHKILNQLDQLRVLSFKGNSLSGQIPDLSGLVNLKSIFLNDNNFSGVFPASIADLHRLKVVVLAGNQISGPIPMSLLKLRRLYSLYLQDNQFTGPIPPLNQTSLRFFNVSNNQLSGEIPMTPPLIQFNASSFLGNINVCGVQIAKQCGGSVGFPPSMSPSDQPSPASKSKRGKLIKIVAGSVGGFVVVVICLVLVWMMCKWSRGRRLGRGGEATRSKAGGVSSWEGEGLGSLVFCGPGDQQMSYSLEDLLKASAETLGRGTMGSTYKAVMESGFIVTVKRLKDASYPRLDEFRRHMDLLGKLRHPTWSHSGPISRLRRNACSYTIISPMAASFRLFMLKKESRM